MSCYASLRLSRLHVLTLEPQTQELSKGHPLQGVRVNVDPTFGDLNQFLPVSGSHGRVTKVINQGQTSLYKNFSDNQGYIFIGSPKVCGWI